MDPSGERFPGEGVSAGAVLLGVVTLIIVGAIVVVTVGRIGTDGEGTRNSNPAVAGRSPTTSAIAEPTAEAPPRRAAPQRMATRGAVRSVLRAYVRAFGAEDAEALVRTMSLGVARRGGPRSVQHGRHAVMSEYQRQFERLVHPRYKLAELSIQVVATGARAHSRYTITSEAAPKSTGSITFELVYNGTRLTIDRIAAIPDAV
jgi:hypothetical protein